jgi:hypothetical protein
VRNTVLKALPGWRCHRDVVRIINSPVGAGEDLLGVVMVNDDGIHRNVREITGLVHPGEGAASGGASHLEHVTRCSRRIGIKAAYRGVTYRQIRGRHGGIERDTQNGAQRHNGVITGNIHPVGL